MTKISKTNSGYFIQDSINHNVNQEEKTANTIRITRETASCPGLLLNN